jgi:hypothetical protein
LLCPLCTCQDFVKTRGVNDQHQARDP